MEENRLIQGRPNRRDFAMLLVLSVRLASTIHYYLQACAPTNILLRRLRARGGLKSAIPAGLLLVPTYLFAAAIATAVIADGGPDWLNLVVLTCIWNAIKFACIASLVPIRKMWRYLCTVQVSVVSGMNDGAMPAGGRGTEGDTT